MYSVYSGTSLNKEHFRANHFVFCREVVCSSEVQNVFKYGKMNIRDLEVCPCIDVNTSVSSRRVPLLEGPLLVVPLYTIAIQQYFYY